MRYVLLAALLAACGSVNLDAAAVDANLANVKAIVEDQTVYIDGDETTPAPVLEAMRARNEAALRLAESMAEAER